MRSSRRRNRCRCPKRPEESLSTGTDASPARPVAANRRGGADVALRCLRDPELERAADDLARLLERRGAAEAVQEAEGDLRQLQPETCRRGGIASLHRTRYSEPNGSVFNNRR